MSHHSIMATHDLDMALELCERTIVMSAGKVAAAWPPGAIFSDDALLEASGVEKPLGIQGCPVCGGA